MSANSSADRLTAELSLFLPRRTHAETMLSHCVIDFFDATFGYGNGTGPGRVSIQRSPESALWTDWIQAVMDDLPHWHTGWVDRIKERSQAGGNVSDLFDHPIKIPERVAVAAEIAPLSGLIFDVCVLN